MGKLYNLTFYTTVEEEYLNQYRDGFDIGLFASREDAEAVKARYCKEVMGFKDYDCDSQITEVSVVGNDPAPQQVYRYVGWNTDEYYDEVDVIESVCYISQSQAIMEMGKTEQQTPRQEWALNRYIVGQCAWQEGFTRSCSLVTRNQCYTYFKITGDFDPDAVTEQLGLQPDETWKIGDLRSNQTEYDFACWSFGRCDDYNPFVEEQMRKTIAPLLDKLNLLNQIRLENDVSFTLQIVPTIYDGDTNPCLAPSLDVIDFCHETRTEIDIDMYIYSK